MSAGVIAVVVFLSGIGFLFLMPPVVWLGAKIFGPIFRALGRWADYWMEVR